DLAWVRPLLLVLTAVFLFGLFSPGIVDTDFWWHLRTGQYLVDQRALPVPDPFAWTTAAAPLAYPTEARTRQLNLTHEWLARLLPIVFAVWANCHGGYFLGFIVLGAYGAESLWLRQRERKLWIVTGLCVAAAALNPNGLGIFRTLLDYRGSYLTSRLLEWSRPH